MKERVVLYDVTVSGPDRTTVSFGTFVCFLSHANKSLSWLYLMNADARCLQTCRVYFFLIDASQASRGVRKEERRGRSRKRNGRIGRRMRRKQKKNERDTIYNF